MQIRHLSISVKTVLLISLLIARGFSASFDPIEEATTPSSLSQYLYTQTDTNLDTSPVLSRQDSFEALANWVYEESPPSTQHNIFDPFSCLDDFSPVDRTSSFQMFLESLKEDLDDQTGASSPSSSSSSSTSNRGITPVETAAPEASSSSSQQPQEGAAVLSSFSVANSFLTDSWWRMTEEPKAKKYSLILKTPEVPQNLPSTEKKKRKDNKIPSQKTRKKRKNRLALLETLAQQDRSLAESLREIKQGLTPTLKEAIEKRENELEAIPTNLSDKEKAKAINKISARLCRKKVTAKIELLKEYLATHPQLNQGIDPSASEQEDPLEQESSAE